MVLHWRRCGRAGGGQNYLKGRPDPFSPRRTASCIYDTRYAALGLSRSEIVTSGGVAQLGEHLPCKQGVMSSNLTISTKVMKRGRDGPHAQANAFRRVSLGMLDRKGIRRIPVMSKMRSICESRGLNRITFTCTLKTEY